MSRGVGVVEQTRPAHNGRIMHQVRDDRGNVFWFPSDVLTEANT